MSVQIIPLDDEHKVSQWNHLVDFMQKHKEWYGSYGTRVMGISDAGLNFARVGKYRVNPEVAIISKEREFNLDYLSKFASGRRPFDDEDKGMEYLMANLFAFLPYSVIDSDSKETPNTKLILPQGLQKTPGGYGFTKPPDFEKEKDRLILEPLLRKGETEVRDFRRWYAPRDGAERGVLRKLIGCIREKYPDMVLLTRFASLWSMFQEPPGARRLTKEYRQFLADSIWFTGAKGLKQWSRIFPKAMKIGWKSYARNDQKMDPSIADVADLDSPPEYDPGKGGASVDGDRLTIYGSDGAPRFIKTNIGSDEPIERLLYPDLSSGVGTLICAFPEPFNTAVPVPPRFTDFILTLGVDKALGLGDVKGLHGVLNIVSGAPVRPATLRP